MSETKGKGLRVRRRRGRIAGRVELAALAVGVAALVVGVAQLIVSCAA